MSSRSVSLTERDGMGSRRLILNLHVAKTFHVSGLGNRVKRVLKTRVSIESRVFKTRDAINIYCFKTGQLTILLDTLCYLARGFQLYDTSFPILSLTLSLSLSSFDLRFVKYENGV